VRSVAVLVSCLGLAAGCWILAGRGRHPGPPAAPHPSPVEPTAGPAAIGTAAALAVEPPAPAERRSARGAPPAGASGPLQVTPPDPFGPARDGEPGRDALERELAGRGRRIAELELELDLCSGGADSAIGRWLATLPPEQSLRWRKAEPELLRRLGSLLVDFPILLYDSEVEWLMDRVRRGEWDQDEVVLFLGPERLKRELDHERLAALRRWDAQGYLD
jgi:hypothetical protein